MSYLILDKNLKTCGRLSLEGSGCPFYNDSRVNQIADDQNGKLWNDTLALTVPYGYPQAGMMIEGYHILKTGSDGRLYCFRITSWEDANAGETKVKIVNCVNLAMWDLSHTLPAPTTMTANAHDAFNYITNGSTWKINLDGTSGGQKTETIQQGTNAQTLLQQYNTDYSVEIRAYVKMFNGQVVEKDMDILDELGEHTGKRVEYGRNMSDVTRTGADDTLFTKIHVYGGTGANSSTPVSIAPVNGGNDFLVDDAANDLYNGGNKYLEGWVQNPNIMSLTGLMTWAKQQLAYYNHPKYSYTVSVAQLGWEPNIGDYVDVVDFSMDPAMTIQARVISKTECEADPTQSQITLGEFVEIPNIMPADIMKLSNMALSTQTLAEYLQEVKAENHVGSAAPSKANDGDFWTDTTDGTVYQFHADTSSWEPVPIKGDQGDPGAPGANGQTSYFHVAYADDANGNGFDQDPAGHTYIGTYVDFTQADSNVPGDYTWAKIQGPEGPQGIQGLQGPKGTQGIQGPAGVGSYTHIAYADSATGTGFTQDPSGKAYIGVYSDNTQMDSTDPSSYKWSLIQGAQGPTGAQGIPGPAGADGQTSYLHIAYATDASGSGFSQDPTDKVYIGTYTDFTSDDSSSPSAYQWAKIQGPQGVQGLQGVQGPQGTQGIQGPTGSIGPQGSTGPAGTPSYAHIAYADSATGSGFSQDPTGKAYVGFYTDSNSTDSSNPGAYVWSLIKGADGAQGPQGIPGPAGSNGQTSYFHVAYATSADGSQGFSTTDPTGKTYIGTYVDYTSDDSTSYSTYAWAKIQGPTGPQGVQGIQGPAGANGVSLYTWVKYATSSAGADMSDSPTGKTYIGLAYNKTTATESTTATDYSWSLIQGPQGPTGSQGIQGPAGANGQPTYTWLKYADSATSGMSDSPTNKKYMGIAYNKTTATESTSYADYSWSLIQGATGAQGPKGDTGPQGIQGPAGANGQSLYTWVKYATSSTGANMSDSPTNMTYIGIAYNKTTSTKSTTATDYSWSLIQGPQGVKGPTGPQGQATYTWVKYADDASGTNMSDSPTGKRYLGLAYNKTTATESTTASDYSWSELYDTTAADLAAEKVRNFTSQPVPPYNVGDLWTQQGATFYCTAARAASDSYNAADWTLQKIVLSNLGTDAQSKINNSLQQSASYGGVVINTSGLTATAGSTTVSMNSTYGFKISKSGSTVFQVDTSGNGTFSGNIIGSTISGGQITQSYNDPTYGNLSISLKNGTLTSTGLDDDGLNSTVVIAAQHLNLDHYAANNVHTYLSATSVALDIGESSSGSLVEISNGGSVTATGVVTGYRLVANGGGATIPYIELRAAGGTPYIDFSNDASSDYDTRIILNSSGTLQIKPAPSANTIQISSSDSNWQNAGTYKATSSSGANVVVGSTGWFYRSTSATKYKEAIAYDIADDYASRILNLNPASWHDKAEDERLAAMAAGFYDGQYDEDAYAQKYYGLIAEDVAGVGLPEFVTYGKADASGNREIEGIEYSRLWVLLIPVVRKQNQEIETLKARVDQLTAA